ncbi:MAG TPA: response regulator [Candidatus Nanoarchaeia archaeon]|nr:response regulator [Candidatus Nanoarchaeia archaeon]
MPTILHIDDDKTIRTTFRMLAKQYRLYEAYSADDGLEKVANFIASGIPLDLVITDQDMNELQRTTVIQKPNGYDVINGLKTRRYDGPVILATTHPFEPARVTQYNTGKITHFDKRKGIPDLVKVVEEILRK